ncbi:MAG: DUF2306 domain-containing protein [Marinosulfonomonas sp.]
MSLLGLLHFVLMIGALAIGARVFLLPKGTPRHKQLGRIFFAGMLISNLVVLTIYRDSGQLGIFHVLAVVSVVSLIAAIALVRLPGAGMGRRIAHGHVMLWSYGGVVAAGLGQSATFLGLSPWPAILICFLLVAFSAYRTNFVGMLVGR